MRTGKESNGELEVFLIKMGKCRPLHTHMAGGLSQSLL